MSQSNTIATDPPAVSVTIDAGDPLTRIRVLDHSLIQVSGGDGYGVVPVALDQGDYILCFEAGNRAEQTKIRIDDKTPQQVPFHRSAPVQFAATAPLSTSTDFSSRQSRCAEAWSARPASSRKDAGLFAYFRGFGATSEALSNRITVSHLRSGTAVPIPNAAEDTKSHCLAYHWSLPPDQYVLAWRSQTNREGRALSVAALPGWQTELFFVCRHASALAAPLSDHGTRVAPLPDFDSIAIFMRRLGEGFKAEDRSLRWCELTRLALERHTAVPESSIEEVDREAAIGQPMLQLQLAYLLLRQRQHKRAMDIVDRLPNGFSDHPDVQCLRTCAREQPDGIVISNPPMIAAAWPELLACSLRHPSKVAPAGSPLFHIADARYDGVWWLWIPNQVRRRDSIRPGVTFTSGLPSQLLELIRDYCRTASGKEPADSDEEFFEGLTPVEQALVFFLDKPKLLETTKLPEDTIANLVRDFGMPHSVLAKVLIELTLKFVEREKATPKKK